MGNVLERNKGGRGGEEGLRGRRLGEASLLHNFLLKTWDLCTTLCLEEGPERPQSPTDYQWVQKCRFGHVVGVANFLSIGCFIFSLAFPWNISQWVKCSRKTLPLRLLTSTSYLPLSTFRVDISTSLPCVIKELWDHLRKQRWQVFEN